MSATGLPESAKNEAAMRDESRSLPASVAAVAIMLATLVLVEDITLRPPAPNHLIQGKSWADEVSESVRSEPKATGQTARQGADGQRAGRAPDSAIRPKPAGPDERGAPAGRDRRP